MEKQQSYWPLYVVCLGITFVIIGAMVWPKGTPAEPTPNPILDQASTLDTLGWQAHAGQTYTISYPTYLQPLAIGNAVEFTNDNFSLSVSEYKTQTQETLESYATGFMQQELGLGQELINPLLPTNIRGASALTFTAKDKVTEVEKKYTFLASPKGIYIKLAQTIHKNKTESQKIIDGMINSLKIRG